MKLLIILLVPILTFGQCSIYGDNAKAKFQFMDSLKNRPAPDDTVAALAYDVQLFTDIRAADADSFDPSSYVAVAGYIVGAKWGGGETCNCHSHDHDDLDIHIEMAADSTEENKAKMMVVEMTRFTRGGTALADVKAMIGQRVRIVGYLFFDEEHKQNATNTNPNGTNLWRATCWEVHPVVRIEKQ